MLLESNYALWISALPSGLMGHSFRIPVERGLMIHQNENALTHIAQGSFLCMGPANERWRYNVMWSVIGWAHAKKLSLIAWRYISWYTFSNNHMISCSVHTNILWLEAIGYSSIVHTRSGDIINIPKTKHCQFDNFVITGGTLSCCNDNLWCHYVMTKLSNWRSFSFQSLTVFYGSIWCRWGEVIRKL